MKQHMYLLPSHFIYMMIEKKKKIKQREAAAILQN